MALSADRVANKAVAILLVIVVVGLLLWRIW